MRNLRHTIHMIVIFAVMLCTLAGCKSDPLPNLTGVLSWNDTKFLKAGDAVFSEGACRVLLMDLKCQEEAIYADRFDGDLWKAEMETGYTYGEYFLENDYRSELLYLACAVNGFEERNMKIGEKATEAMIEAAQAYAARMSEAEREFSKADEDDVLELYIAYYKAKLWSEAITADVNPEISEEEARIVQLKQIYVTDRATAEEVYNQASLGVNFDSLAAIYNRSSDYTIFLSRFDRSEAYTNEAFSLLNGQIGQVIEENGGYYIIACENSYEKDRTEVNKERVLREKKNQILREEYLRFLDDNKISINKHLWGNLELAYNEDIKIHSLFEIYREYLPE